MDTAGQREAPAPATEAELGVTIDLDREYQEVSSYDRGWWDGYRAAEGEYVAFCEAEIRVLEARIRQLTNDLRDLRRRDPDGEDRSC